MSKHVCATSSCGREEYPSITEQIELEALARFICHDLGHQAGVRFGCCDSCLEFAARLFAFQKEA